MTATVHVLHSKPSPIGSFLRVGHTGHRKLEALIAASRLRFRRFVFDAAHVDEQTDWLQRHDLLFAWARRHAGKSASSFYYPAQQANSKSL